MPTPTPNPADQYTRWFAELYDQRNTIALPTAFQSFFGNPAGGGLTHFERDQGTFEIDIIKQSKTALAGLVHRGQSSDAVDNPHITDEEYTNIARKWPLVQFEGNINSAKLMDRIAGDNPYARKTQLARARTLAKNIHYEQIRKASVLWEYLARESILTGKQPVILGTTNTDLIYDYYRLATHTVGVTVPWDNSAADIFLDIDNALTLVEEDSGIIPDFFALGGTVMSAFINNESIQKLANIKNYEIVRVGTDFPIPPKFQRYTSNGWTPYAMIITPLGREVYMFTNSKTFINMAGTTENYMPKDKAFFLSSSARYDRQYGPRDRLPVTPQEAQWHMQFFGFNMASPPLPPNPGLDTSIIKPEAFYFDAYPAQDKKNVTMRLQSAPVFATTATDTIIVLEDLITP